MARFEVYIPASDPEGMNLTLRVTADTWMAALKVGLKKIGEGGALPKDVLCDIQDDESIHVTDARSSRVFRIAQIPEVSDPGKAPPLPATPWMASPSDPPAPPVDEQRLAAAREQERRAAAVAVERELAERAAHERAAVEARAQAEAKAAAERAAAAEEAAKEARALAEQAAFEARAAAAEKAKLERAAREKAAQEQRAAQKAQEEREAAERAAAEAKAQADAQETALRAARAAAEQKARAEAAAQEKATAEATALARARKAREDAGRAAAEAAEHVRREEGKRPSQVKVVEAKSPRSKPPPVIGREELPRADLASTEEALVDLFERAPAVFDKPREEALYLLLDLAMEKIPCDSGSVYVADLNRRDLAFAAVRGPKAKELLALGLRVPMGKGFVGFCAQEGVAVAISDAQRDDRFFKEISQRIGYETKSMLTSPILAGGQSLGAIQLINKQGSNAFTQGELSVLHYLAHQAALYLERQPPA